MSCALCNAVDKIINSDLQLGGYKVVVNNLSASEIIKSS